ncbi:MAG: hypothetical protein MUF77_09450, partial [Leptospira sp.]|nr:hypothetical protein [Leptospira sp.]
RSEQFLVPFARLGSSATLVSSRSDQAPRPGVYAGLGWDYGFGMELNLSVIEPLTQAVMDSDFGVNHTFLVFEYLRSQSLLRAPEPMLAREEIRLGLRFHL